MPWPTISACLRAKFYYSTVIPIGKVFLLLPSHCCIHSGSRTTATITIPFNNIQRSSTAYTTQTSPYRCKDSLKTLHISTIRHTNSNIHLLHRCLSVVTRINIHSVSMPSPSIPTTINTTNRIHLDDMNTTHKTVDRLSAVADSAATASTEPVAPPATQMASDASINTRILKTIPDQLSFPYQLPANNNFICNDKETEQALVASSEALHASLPVGMPTETVYGLAANALDVAAVQRIFHAKGRPSDNPLIVHISSLSMLIQVVAPWSTLGKVALPPDTLTYPPSTYNESDTLYQQHYEAAESTFAQLELPLAVRRIIRKGWPGPLTLLLPRHPRLSIAVTCGRPTVGVRFPAHPMARAMIAHANLPLAAPSANTSGRPSPTRAQHVFTDLHGRIPLILDAGACQVGVESTVLDCARTPPAILRPGGVTDVELRQWAGSSLDQLQVYQRDFSDAQLELAPTTPGMKYRHYSPTASVILFECRSTQTTTRQQIRQHVLDKAVELYQTMNMHHNNPVIGLLSIDDDDNDNNDNRLTPIDALNYPYIQQYSLGASTRPDQVAHRLFDGLRTLDAYPHLEWILVEGIPDQGQGIAVMNRLRKAASSIVQV